MSETMPAVEVLAAFRNSLPPHIARGLSGAVEFGVVEANVSRLVRNGWTVKQVVEHCTYGLGGVDNAAAVITSRLKSAPDEPSTAKPSSFASAPFCSPECEERRGWLEDENHNPLRRCPCRTS